MVQPSDTEAEYRRECQPCFLLWPPGQETIYRLFTCRALSPRKWDSEVFYPHGGTSHPLLSFPAPADVQGSWGELQMLELTTGAS